MRMSEVPGERPHVTDGSDCWCKPEVVSYYDGPGVAEALPEKFGEPVEAHVYYCICGDEVDDACPEHGEIEEKS